MKLWMSRSAITKQYTFWYEQPDVTWNDVGEPRIGYDIMNTDKQVCGMGSNVHILFPNLEIPPGEMAEVELIELENGYYISIVD